MRLGRWRAFASIARDAAVAAAAVGVAGLAFWMWPTARRVDETSAVVLTCKWFDEKLGVWRSNPNCLASSIAAVTGEIKASGATITKALPAIADSAKKSAAKSVEASEAMVGMMKRVERVLVEAEGLLRDLRSAKAALDELAKILRHAREVTMPEVDAILKPLASDAERVGRAIDDLDAQVAKGGNLDRVAEELAAAVASLNARVADPKVASAVSHLDGASANLERLIGNLAAAFNPRKLGFWKSLGLKMIPLGLGHLIPQRVSVTNEPIEVEEKP